MNKQQQEAKNYLMGAKYIDISIRCKLAQIDSLNDLATKATATLSDMPGGPNRNIHRLEDVIVKIIDLQNEISEDINDLIATKENINRSISGLDDREERTVLEERYLRGSKWEDIARTCDCSMRQIFRIHDGALKKIEIF